MDKIVAAFQITWGIIRNTYYRVIDALDIFWKGMLAIFLALGIIMVVVMSVLIKVIGGKSGKNFMQQQKNLGKINGFIEEMMEGQKIVKVQL